MRSPHVNDFVRLTRDVPELALIEGEIGVVRSESLAPEITFDVEFHHIGLDCELHALLAPEQLEVEDGPLLKPDFELWQ